jgi:serine/threonine protein kinase
MARESCERNRVTNDAERDERVMILVERALGRPAEEREAYLREACDGDTDLLDETSRYVQQEEQMGAFLHDPIGLFWNWDWEFVPGQLLAERFEIRGVLGEGGMAWVYEATDRTTRERVAIKCPKPEFRGRLLPETVISRKVTHDNVCRVHEVHRAVTADGEMEFLSMEFLDGETLEERLDREKRLSLKDTKKIARQLGEGLAAAHSQDIVHGDLKPNNIMLSKNVRGELRVVITDFGLARPSPTSEPSPPASVLFGAPDYIAPELLNGIPRSAASDIFALGVILYEALGGERPKSEIKPIRGVPRRASQVIRRCLNPEPAARPQTVREILAELEGQWSNVRKVWTAAVTVVLFLAAGLWVAPGSFQLRR